MVDYFLNLVDPRRWERFLAHETGASGEPDTWGFTKRSSVAQGDRLICLLMERQLWCGVFEVEGDPLAPDDPRIALDPILPVRFPVRTLVALPAERAIDVFDPGVWPFLSRTKRIEPRARHWNVRAGLRVDLARFAPEDGAFLLGSLLAQQRQVPAPDDAPPSVFDLDGAADTREWVMRQIAARRGQGAFREGLLRAYQGRCAITGCDVVDVLEAAHITPHRGRETNHITNGLLLRADLHTLFDCGLIGVDPDKCTVVLQESLHGSEYMPLHGQPIRRPAAVSEAPSAKALRWHMEAFGLTADRRRRACPGDGINDGAV